MEYSELKKVLTYSKAKEVFEKKGYAFFDTGDFNLNIFGIRLKIHTNEFDDAIAIAYRENGKAVIKVYQATTDPGREYMHNPINKQIGTAILVEGQYRGSHHVAHHQGKYLALCQKKPLTVYRDTDMDSEHDMEPLNKRTGVYGINIHRSNPNTESQYVDKWSAGCQVFKKAVNFNAFMDTVSKASSIYGNTFTYTLLNGKDFE